MQRGGGGEGVEEEEDYSTAEGGDGQCVMLKMCEDLEV